MPIDIQQFTTWAIRPDYFERLAADLARFHAAVKAEDDPRMQMMMDGYSVNGAGVALVPVYGPLIKSSYYYARRYGVTPYQRIQESIDAAVADARVRAIVLDVESPGGSVAGVETFTETVRRAAGALPVVAFTDGNMCSAAYWAASAADALVVGKTAAVGSIGVIYAHMDWSKSDEKFGVKITLITAGKYKAVGSDTAPLSEQDRHIIQTELDSVYDVFIGAVADNRRVAADTVRAQMADGRVFIGADAKAAGLVDRIGTLEEAVALALEMAGASASTAYQPFIGATAPPQEKGIMDKKKLIESLTTDEVVAGNPAVAEELRRQGAAGVDADANARQSAERVMGIVTAAIGKETADQIARIVASGVTAEQYAAIVGDATPLLPKAQDTSVRDKQEILEALKKTGADNPGANNGSEAGGKDFPTLVAEHQQVHKCSLFDAQAAVIKAHPQVHQDYLKSMN